MTGVPGRSSLRRRLGHVGIAIAAASAIPAAVVMTRLYADLRPELDELLPTDSPAARGARALRARMAGTQHLGVVIRGAVSGPPAAFAAKLGERLASFGARHPHLIRSVRTDVAAERAFLEKRGALYLPLFDLREIAGRLEARIHHDKARANPLFVSLDEDPDPPPLDFFDIEARARARNPLAEHFAGDRLISKDGRIAVVLVFLATVEAGAGALAPILAGVRAEVAALDPQAAGLEVGYAGDAAIAVEELTTLESDIVISALLVLGGVALSILLAFRFPRALPALCLPLFVGTVWGFAFASLFVPSLGSSTAFLGSIVVGNGINPGIMLLARYLEERRRGASARDARRVAISGTWRGTLAAAVAAAAGYASLGTTSFRGFSEFGIIAASGALSCWLATYLFLPRLLVLLDRAPRIAGAFGAGSTTGRSLTDFLLGRRARVVLGVSLLIVAAAAALVPRIDRNRIEYDMSKLRSRDSLRSGEGYWARQMDAVLGRNFTAVIFMTESDADARRVGSALADAVKREPLSRVASRLVTPEDVVPPDQAEKGAELDRIRRLLTPGVVALLSETGRASLDRFIGAGAGGPLGPAEIPTLLTEGLREKDGRLGRNLLMLQSLDGSTWDGAVTIRAASAMQAVARTVSPPAAVAGGFVVSAAILETLAAEALPTTAFAFAAVVVVVVVLLRFGRDTVLVLASLLAGCALLGGLVVALDLRINFLSFIAFPITFGIGVEYALNVVARHRREPGSLRAVVAGTGGAVALCSFTTILGYGSLLLARNQALASFGLLAVLGEICCLFVAVLALPAALSVFRRR